MKIIFMGTPEFSVPILKQLVSHGHEVIAVYTQPPRPAGRGKKARLTAVHKVAQELDLNVRHPTGLRQLHLQSEFNAFQADIAVVVAYGLILPQAILEMPKLGCLNIHASLLPRWRGAAPIHRAIMAGDRKTGISIMQMEAGLDTGPVLLKKSIDIEAQETTKELHDRLSQLGAEAIIETLCELPNLPPCPQPEEGVCYAEKIEKSEALIDWSLPADHIDRVIRALSPFPGAWTTWQGIRIKCLGSELIDVSKSADHAGEVVGPLMEIACGEGRIRVTHLQRAGKSVQAVDDFLRGNTLNVGDKLGT